MDTEQPLWETCYSAFDTSHSQKAFPDPQCEQLQFLLSHTPKVLLVCNVLNIFPPFYITFTKHVCCRLLSKDVREIREITGKPRDSNPELNRLELSINLNPFKELRETLPHQSEQPVLGDV